MPNYLQKYYTSLHSYQHYVSVYHIFTSTGYYQMFWSIILETLEANHFPFGFFIIFFVLNLLETKVGVFLNVVYEDFTEQWDHELKQLSFPEITLLQ